MVISVENNFLFLVSGETRRSHLQMSAIISSWEWVARMMAGPVGVEDTEVTHGLNGLYGLARGEIDMRLWQLIDLCYGGQRREMTSGQGRPGGLTSSAAAAPPRLMLSVICQYWSVRGEGGIIRNYHQQPHFRAVTSTSARPASLTGGWPGPPP